MKGYIHKQFKFLGICITYHRINFQLPVHIVAIGNKKLEFIIDYKVKSDIKIGFTYKNKMPRVKINLT